MLIEILEKKKLLRISAITNVEKHVFITYIRINISCLLCVNFFLSLKLINFIKFFNHYI